MSDSTTRFSTITEDITANTSANLSTLSKQELLEKCEQLGIIKCKSKTKTGLIELLTQKNHASPQRENVSPLRYPGGKTRACKIIYDILLEQFGVDFVSSCDTLVSPFFGGGSFEFYFQNNSSGGCSRGGGDSNRRCKLLVNDKFAPLFNFWTQVKTNAVELCDTLDNIPEVTKEMFVECRNNILSLDADPMQQAVNYFIINRCSFSGATLSGGFSEEASKKRYTPSAVAKIWTLDLTNVDVYGYDFEEFLDMCCSRGDLGVAIVFADPPYYLESKSKLYGNNGDMHESFDHERLFRVMDGLASGGGVIGAWKWIITYNDCAHIRELYKKYVIIPVNWSYGMNKSKTSSEIIIVSHYADPTGGA